MSHRASSLSFVFVSNMAGGQFSTMFVRCGYLKVGRVHTCSVFALVMQVFGCVKTANHQLIADAISVSAFAVVEESSAPC